MRKVVFVGGSSYSGSTFLDLMLANSRDGFSCGEVSQMFYPFRQHHFNIICGCGDPECSLWHKIQRAGVDRLYDTIFELFPSVSYIVDSSKDPLWIQQRTKTLIRSGVGIENVLIWKTPEEYYHSCAKRGQERRWENAWINYHRLYFRMIDDWHAVRCADVVASPDSLRLLCEQIGVPYFEGKHRYWEKVHHMLFGNHSAKRHLYQKGTKAYERSNKVQRDSFKKYAGHQFSEVSHQAIVSERPSLSSKEGCRPRISPISEQIMRVLESQSIAPHKSQEPDKDQRRVTEIIDRLKASRAYEFRRRTRRDIGTRTMRLFMQLKNGYRSPPRRSL
jgi:hypothetical protein